MYFWVGVLSVIAGFFILYRGKKHEMENMTDGGVVKHKSVMSGFGWHMAKPLAGGLILVGIVLAVFNY